MKHFNVLLVGCGGMANTWIKYLLTREDVTVVALCDIIHHKANDMSKQYNIECKTFDNINSAFIECKNINLVVDTTSPDAHELIVTTALNNGCNVIGEKPMAETRKQALNQIECANKNNKTYSVMQNRRYLPGMQTLHKAVNDNVIGRLGTLSSDFFIGAHFGGFRDLMDNVLILDMAVHTFYQARFIINANPISVYCHEFNPHGSWYKGNASAIAIFEFSNGVVYDYRGSWCSEGHNTTWECDWRLIGENGSIKWDGANKPIVQVKKENGQFINACDEFQLDLIEDKKHYGHEGCFDEMFDALIENRYAQTDCHDNFYCTNMVYGAIESAKTGKKILL